MPSERRKGFNLEYKTIKHLWIKTKWQGTWWLFKKPATEQCNKDNMVCVVNITGFHEWW